MKGYKAFDKDFKCRGFQFEVGKEYEEKPAIICERGFHFCENPFDVLSYYSLAESRFAEVEADGEIVGHDFDSKHSSTKIKITAEIGLPGFVNAGVKFILDHVTSEKEATNTGYRSAATNTGYRSAATNTGDRSAATNTGGRSAATNTGGQSAATNTGGRSAATNTGYQSAATNTGGRSAATNTGGRSAATNTGYQSAATNTGYRSAATNTGYQSAATNTGYQSAATNTGEQSAATNTGYRSAATNIGYRSAATNTGEQSAATNTGDRSAAEVSGSDSISCGLGWKCKARGSLGCWIVLAERDDEGKIITVASARVDGEKIKIDAWYTLENGNFVEV